VDASAATARIARTLRSMAPIDRETLLLYAWADLTYEGIAAAMEVPVGTVRSRLYRARRTLRTRLNPETLDETENDHGRLAAAPRNA
jgi:RNA polymerase sigma factor (sigma-70 family)